MADGRFGSARNAGEESPDTTRRHAPRKRGRAERKFFATESVTENKPLHPPMASAQNARAVKVDEARVKRRGKSPPPRAKARGHDKPHAVQDKTGGKGRLPQSRGKETRPPGNSRSPKGLLRRQLAGARQMTAAPNRFGDGSTKSGLQPSNSGGDSQRNRLRPSLNISYASYVNN